MFNEKTRGQKSPETINLKSKLSSLRERQSWILTNNWREMPTRCFNTTLHMTRMSKCVHEMCGVALSVCLMTGDSQIYLTHNKFLRVPVMLFVTP
jgi:hypothetical protein